MKSFFILLLFASGYYNAFTQCSVPVITASGPTTFCAGGSVTLSAPVGNVWTQKADFGGVGRDYAVGFTIGSKGYIGTGRIVSSAVKDFWEYDPSTNAWTQKADFGGAARYAAVGFSIGNRGYIGTGGGAGNLKDFWEYNPATNVWIQKADFGGTGRQGATGFSIGNKGYIGTGLAGVSVKDFWEYDPATNLWTQRADFGGSARWLATSFSIGSRGYIGVGRGNFRDFWEYNPSTNTWAQKADFGGSARGDAASFSIGNKGYIGTGFADSYKRDFWEYNLSTNTWTQKPDFGGTSRFGAVGFSIGSKGYIGTGGDGSIKKDFWEYDPGYTYTWSPGGATTSSINVSTSGNYTVTTTNATGCAATSAATTVTVNLLPAKPTITPSGPTTFCAGGSVTLTAPLSTSYLWSNNATTQSIIVNQSGSYSVVVKNSNGCSGVSSDPTIVTVNEGPAKPVITANGPTTFCPGGSVTLTAPLSSSYLWSNNATTQSITVSQGGSYTVSVTNAQGCSATSEATIITISDTENPTIIAPAGINVSSDAGKCYAAITNLGTPITNDNCTIQSVTNDAPANGQFAPGTHTVTWTVKDAVGNTATTTQTITVTDSEKPVLGCPADQALCYNSSGTYTIPAVTATDNCGIQNISYAITGATTRSSSGNIASGAFNVGVSTINWTVTDVNGNISTCSTKVTVNAAVQAIIGDAKALNSNGVLVNTVYVGYTPASAITLTVNGNGGSGNYTYQWSNGATTQSIWVSPTTTTAYTVTVADGSNCTATATKTVQVIDIRCGNKMDKVSICHHGGNTLCISSDNTVGDHLAHGDYLGVCNSASVASIATSSTLYQEEMMETSAKASVYPNPSKGQFNLRLPATKATKVDVQVLNMQGIVLKQQTIQTGGKGQTARIGLANPKAGTYLIKIITEEGVQVLKVLIQP